MKYGLRLGFSEILLGLAVLSIAVYAASLAGPGIFEVEPVGVSFFPHSALTEKPIFPSLYPLLAAYFLLIAFVGKLVFLDALSIKGIKFSWPTLFFGGFVPGYLLIAAANRCVTLLLPHSLAPGFIVVALATTALICSYRAMARPALRAAFPIHAESLLKLGAAILFFGFILVYLLQRQGVHIVGDNIIFYEPILSGPDTGTGSSGRLVLISQGYDEFSVLYPFFYGVFRSMKSDFLPCYWLLYAFFATGAVSLLYMATRTLGLKAAESVLVLMALGFGSFTLKPGVGILYLLFDACNPLSQLINPSHFLATLIVISGLALVKKSQEEGGLRVRHAPALMVILACGIATSSVTNVQVLGLMLFLAACLALVKKLEGATPFPKKTAQTGIAGVELAETSQEAVLERGRSRGQQLRSFLKTPVKLNQGNLEILLAALLLVYPMLAYVNLGMRTFVSPYFLLSILALFAYYLARFVLPFRQISAKSARELFTARPWGPLLLAYIGGSAMSLGAFGNVAIEKVASLFSHSHSLWGIPIVDRNLELTAPLFTWEAIGPYVESAVSPMQHSLSTPNFVARFGMSFIFASAGILLFRKFSEKTRETRLEAPGQEILLYFRILVVFIGLYLAHLFLFDFMAGNLPGVTHESVVWARSRLVEPWYYAIFYVFFVLQRKLYPGRLGTALFCFFIAFVVKEMLIYPNVAGAQWLVNATFIAKKLLRL